ncbi:MAG TPA: hypothetical protein VKU37_05325 [Verrucomicrobiae bacterium]|nr:hypothetical protein [Verrucomicrobiae bacterium]
MAEKGQVNCHCCSGNCRKSGSYRNRNRLVQRYACDRCGKSFSESQPLDGLRVDFDKACQVVHMLCESVGIRPIERLTGLSRPTVLTVLETAGQKAADFLNERVHDVRTNWIQADEVHGFVFSKQINTDADDVDRGEQFTYLALANDSKLIINWLVGKRTRENALEFMTQLKRRVTGDFQLATDGWKIYSGRTGAVATVFGQSIDYGTETKYFGTPRLPYLPRKLIGMRRHRVSGNPDLKKSTICHAERSNLTLRTFTRRLTRCTLGYSKKLENLRHSIALFVWHYNFCRVHSSLGKTPAQAAGLTDRVWTIKDLLS